jgi:cation:H+ antiporter
VFADQVPAPAPVPDSAAAAPEPTPSVRKAMTLFGLAAIVTLIAGVMLEKTGSELAANWGMNGVLFGATILAAASALPEISTGITAVRLGRNTLVFGDMFGGNAFQLTLFLLADILAGEPVLPSEGRSNAWIALVGLAMTAVFVVGIVLRPKRRHAGLGADSWVAVVVYALGLWGLVVVSS